MAATYLMGASGPMYRKPANSADVRWYVSDGLGSVVGEVDVNGNLTSSTKRDVYGLTRSASGVATSRQGFVGQSCGHVADPETGGLVYMRARYYDPGVGRFTSQDARFKGVNWFIYCHDDPVNFYDVSGQEDTVAEVTVSETGEATISGVGLDLEATEITADLSRAGTLTLDIKYIQSAGFLNIRAMLQAIKVFAETGNIRAVFITAGGFTLQGERLIRAMEYIIGRMGDVGGLRPLDNGVTQLYWLFQNGD